MPAPEEAHAHQEAIWAEGARLAARDYAARWPTVRASAAELEAWLRERRERGLLLAERTVGRLPEYRGFVREVAAEYTRWGRALQALLGTGVHDAAARGAQDAWGMVVHGTSRFSNTRAPLRGTRQQMVRLSAAQIRAVERAVWGPVRDERLLARFGRQAAGGLAETLRHAVAQGAPPQIRRSAWSRSTGWD